MAGTFIDELAFNTRVDSEGVREGLSQVEGMFKRTMNNILNNFVAPLTGALAVGRLFGNYTQQADKIAKFSKSLNINAEELQVWGEAAALAGGSAQAFQNSVRMLQRRISMSGDSAGKGGDMFKKLGIDIKDASGKTKDAFQIMSELAAKADTMDKVEFAGMAQRLRIDQGTIQLLQKGSAGVKELVDEMRQFGVITEEDSKSAEEYNDAMTKFRRSTSVAAAKVFSALLPPISQMITLFAKLVAILTKHKALLRGSGFTAMAVAIGTKLLPMIKRLKGAMTLKNLGEWGKLAALFTTLYLIIEDFVVWLQGGQVALAGLWEQFGTAEEVKQKLSDLKDTVVSVVGWLGKFAPGLKVAAATLMLISAELGAILAYQKVVTFVKTLAGAFKTLGLAMAHNVALTGIILALILIVSYWDELKAAALACWNFLTNLWNGFADWFLGIFNGIGEGLKNWWNGILDFFIGGWKGMLDGLLSFLPDKIKNWITGGSKKSTTNAGSEENELTKVISSTLYYSPAATAAIEAIPSQLGNITTDNSKEVHIQNVNVESNDVPGMLKSVDNAVNGRLNSSGNNMEDVADNLAQGQH